MLKNNYYNIPIDKDMFFKIIENNGVETFNMKLITIINYDKENMEFSNADYQYQYLELKEIKTDNNEETNIIYKHYYPENETYYNMEKNITVKIGNFKDMQEILKNLGCKVLSKQVVKEMTTEILGKYYMRLKECDNAVYIIEFQTMDNHYITKEDYEELNNYLKKYNINHVENVF